MPPRVAYWTSAYDPSMEAVAGEVALLRRCFPGSVTWGLNPTRWFRLTRLRGVCMSPRLHLFFRAATALLEPIFHLNHIFGSLADWFYLQGARTRPTILTLATAGPVASADLLDRVDRFVVESPEGRDQLTQFGIDSTRVSLIFPPVDLQRFRPAAKPRGPYTVLFASSPDRSDWLEARGVPLLLEAAGLRPQYRFRLLWRPWGNSEREVRRLIAERGLANVELLVGRQADMVDQYRMSDVCVAPFLDAERCKPAPNSITESLACGRPVVTSACVGLSGLIQESGAGLVCSNDAVSLADCFDRLNAEWDRYSLGARRLAEQCFDSERFVRAYGDLYGEILGCKAA